MKKDLIIIGAGNVGGFLALNQDLFEEKFNIIGFLDDDERKQGESLWKVPVLGTIDEISNYKDASVAIGISNPKVKERILKRIGADFHFPSFVSENAWISKNVSIGKGVIIYPGVSINHESQIGNFVVINMNAAIGHNCTIEDHCSLAPGVNFAGFTHVESLVEIGIGASTIQKVRIGQGAIIGGQTMLICNAEKDAVYVGVPGLKKE